MYITGVAKPAPCMRCKS